MRATHPRVDAVSRHQKLMDIIDHRRETPGERRPHQPAQINERHRREMLCAGCRGNRTAWVVSIVPWVRTPWVVRQGRSVAWTLYVHPVN